MCESICHRRSGRHRSRFGYERNKLFYPLCGEPVLTHTLRHIFAARSVSEVVIVHSRVDEKEIRRLVDDLHPIQPVRYALGGAERKIRSTTASWPSAATWMWSWSTTAPGLCRPGLV